MHVYGFAGRGSNPSGRTERRQSRQRRWQALARNVADSPNGSIVVKDRHSAMTIVFAKAHRPGDACAGSIYIRTIALHFPGSWLASLASAISIWHP